MTTALGVDIGGSHITAALVSLKTAGVLPGTKIRTRVDANAPAGEIISAWWDTIRKVMKQAPGQSGTIGFAMPGPFDYENGISWIRNLHKYDALYGMNIKKLLADLLHIDPTGIRLRNDSEAYLAGECLNGAAKGYQRAIGITLGTGLGSARSVNGRAADVNLGSSPFQDSIADDYLSTRWFVKQYRELTGQAIAGVKELLELRAGPQRETVEKILQAFCQNLATFLDGFIATEQPEIVVIGGNIAEAYDVFFPPVKKLLRTDVTNVAFRKAALGEDAALIGAVGYWLSARTVSEGTVAG